MIKVRSYTTLYGENTVVYDLRISPYMVTEKYDRNAKACNTVVHGVRKRRPGYVAEYFHLKKSMSSCLIFFNPAGVTITAFFPVSLSDLEL